MPGREREYSIINLHTLNIHADPKSRKYNSFPGNAKINETEKLREGDRGETEYVHYVLLFI